MTGGLFFPHRYVFDDIPEKFRGLYLRLSDVQQLKVLRILDEDVAVPQIELITRHWSTALSSAPDNLSGISPRD
jgi:hypothetical protein